MNISHAINYTCPHCHRETNTPNVRFICVKYEWEYWDCTCTHCGCVAPVQVQGLQFKLNFPPSNRN